jgi:hypothetical protein
LILRSRPRPYVHNLPLNLNFSIISTTSTSTLHRCFAKYFHSSTDKVLRPSDSSCKYVGIVTVVCYLHFASLIYPCSPLLLHTFRLRSPSSPPAINLFRQQFQTQWLQVNSAFSLVRIRYISTISLASLSICFHPICSADFSKNQLRLLLEFIFGFKLKSALFISITELPSPEVSIHFQYHPTCTSIAELPAAEFSIHFH